MAYYSNIRPHPNVLQVLGVSTDGIAPAIIMEYCPGGSLDLLLFDKSKEVAADYQFRLILGIARGMLHLHKNNIVHRDLAARNILVRFSLILLHLFSRTDTCMTAVT
jgi:serine/threonine protein kinase